MKALAKLAADASGIEDNQARSRFRADFLANLKSDPDFLRSMQRRAELANISTLEPS
jgi:hypothetical protein